MQQSGVIGTRRSDALVFFGATGDLAYKKIFPALQALVRARRPRHAGHRRRARRLDARQAARRACATASSTTAASTRTRSRKLSAQLHYVDGDYRDPATFERLRQRAGRRARVRCTTSPSRRACSRPSSQGLARVRLRRRTRGSSSRSRSAATSRRRSALNRTLHAVFPESAIFRIDHYLGKEAVQNLLYFRFANALPRADLEPQLRRQRADHDGRELRRAGPRQRSTRRSARSATSCRTTCCRWSRCWRWRRRSASDARGDARREAAPVPGDAAARSGARSCAASSAAIATSPASRPTRTSRRSPRCGCTSTPGAGPACRSTSAPASACRVTATEVVVDLKPPPLRDLRRDRADSESNYFRFRLSPEVLIVGGRARQAPPASGCVGEPVELVARHEPQRREVAVRATARRRDARRRVAVHARRRGRGGVARRRPDPRRARTPRVYEPGTLGPGGGRSALSPATKAGTTRRPRRVPRAERAVAGVPARRRQHAARQRPLRRRPARALERTFGARAARPLLGRCIAAVRDETGYADYLGRAAAFPRRARRRRADCFASVEFLLDYPFADRLYPRALDVVARLGTRGSPLSCSPTATSCSSRARSTARACGMRSTAACSSACTRNARSTSCSASIRRSHYAIVDDKPQLLAAMKARSARA